ncbi:MAG: metal ABC transporter permease [Acidimicrobiales bacterium]
MTWLFEPGLWSSQPVHTAALLGALVAAVSALVGVFTVIRGQSFAGHALTDVSTAGGSGAVLVSANPVVGFVGAGLVGAAAMEVIGIRRVRGRDLATGIVLGASIGLAALFLHFTAMSTAASGAAQHILFGSIFATQPSTVPLVALFGVASVGILVVVYRPLLLSSVSDDVAAARGVPVRWVGLLFMLALATAVGLSSLAIGSILSTALLVGPAATALRLTRRLGWALVVAAAVGVGGTWLGVVLAYDSYYWGAGRQGVPVSFFIVAVLFAAYLAASAVPGRR